MEQQLKEIERMVDLCHNLLQPQPHQRSPTQEEIARCVSRRAKIALEALATPGMDYPAALAELTDAKEALISTRAAEYKHRHAIHDLKVMQMYRYSKLYSYTGDEERPDPLAQHSSRLKDGCPGPSSISKNVLQPGSAKDIRDLLHSPERFMKKGDDWWVGLYMGIQQDRAIVEDWEQSLVGKGKSKQPEAPYVQRLREILDLLQERDNFMVMDTIRFYLSRYGSQELTLYQLWNNKQYGIVARCIHEDLRLFDRRVPEGYDGSLMKDKVRSIVDDRFLIEEDEETGELVSWIHRG